MFFIPSFQGFIQPAYSELWTPAQLGSSTLLSWATGKKDGNGDFQGTLNGSGYITSCDDLMGNNNGLYQGSAGYEPYWDETNEVMVCDNDFLRIPNSISIKSVMAVVRNANGSPLASYVMPVMGGYGTSSYTFLRNDSSGYSISIDGASNDTGDISINGSDLEPGDGSGTNITVTGFDPFSTHDEPDELYAQSANNKISWKAHFALNVLPEV